MLAHGPAGLDELCSAAQIENLERDVDGQTALGAPLKRHAAPLGGHVAQSMHLFEPRHFIAPFLAHALGTLAGAEIAFRIAASRKALVAYVIGVFFLCGGIAASLMIPAPAWFIALDLIGAYLPMAWLATRMGGRKSAG